jgi:hypothetical protein
MYVKGEHNESREDEFYQNISNYLFDLENSFNSNSLI